MKIWKKYLALMLALVLCLSLAAAAPMTTAATDLSRLRNPSRAW